MTTIYHNPRCSKSRASLAALEERGIEPTIVNYLETPPGRKELADILDKLGIAVRAGHHCAMPLHHRCGVAATTRASFYVHTTRKEIDKLVAGLHHVREVFRL